MVWVPHVIIVLGLLMLGAIPVMIAMIRIDPMLVVRPAWHDNLTPEAARLVGIVIVAITLVGGLWAIFSGIRLL